MIAPGAPAATSTSAAAVTLAASPAAACVKSEPDAPADLTGLDAGLREAITRAAIPSGAASDCATARAPTCGELAAVEALALAEREGLMASTHEHIRSGTTPAYRPKARATTTNSGLVYMGPVRVEVKSLDSRSSSAPLAA